MATCAAKLSSSPDPEGAAAEHAIDHDLWASGEAIGTRGSISIIAIIFEQMLSTLMSSRWHADFLEGLRMLGVLQCSYRFTVGSACSGTELLAALLPKLFEIIHKTFGDGMDAISTVHRWSCENAKWKAQWIRHGMHSDLIFCDVLGIKETEALAWSANFASRIYQQVVSTFLFTAGFSCRSVSSLNTKRHLYSSCISGEGGGLRGTTGATWIGVIEHIRVHRPFLFWLENERGLLHKSKARTSSNLDSVVSSLCGLGYLTVFFVISLERHGVGVRRARVWILGICKPDDTREETMLDQGEAKKLEQALRQKPIPFGEFMVSASDEDALLFGAGPKLGEAKKDSFETCKAKDKNKKYVKLHRKMWSAL